MSQSNQRSAAQTLDEEYLLMRAKLLEVAASFDRIHRGDGDASNDPRMAEIARALSILHKRESESDLAEQLQLTFSLPYKNDWQSDFGLC